MFLLDSLICDNKDFLFIESWLNPNTDFCFINLFDEIFGCMIETDVNKLS